MSSIWWDRFFVFVRWVFSRYLGRTIQKLQCWEWIIIAAQLRRMNAFFNFIAYLSLVYFDANRNYWRTNLALISWLRWRYNFIILFTTKIPWDRCHQLCRRVWFCIRWLSLLRCFVLILIMNIRLFQWKVRSFSLLHTIFSLFSNTNYWNFLLIF